MYSNTLHIAEKLFPQKGVRWTVYIILWTLIGTLSALHWRLFPAGAYPYTWLELLRIKIILWYTWGIITPIILYLGYRCSSLAVSLSKQLILLLLYCVLIISGYLILYTSLVLFNIYDTIPNNDFMHMLRFVIRTHSTYYFLAFWTTIGVEYAIKYYNKYHEREIEAFKLQSQIVQAQLKSLRSQLQPHFLFNTMHSIVALVRKEDTKKATSMLIGLSDLLRLSLDNTVQHEVTMADELELLDRYIAIEKIRFADQLIIKKEISPDTLQAYVPNFILQPLVENAIKHGVEHKEGDGEVTLKSFKENDSLVIEISDNGNPTQSVESNTLANGVGLRTTRERLKALYKEDAQFELLNADDNIVTVAKLRLPFHTEPLKLNGTS